MLNAYILNLAAELWGKKWRGAIILELRIGPLRFSELKKKLPGCSVKVLSEVLDELENNSLVIRKQYGDTMPVKVTYQLHDGADLLIQAHVGYHQDLLDYFYSERNRFELPEHIIQELEERVTNK
jgi:DNA-binding HxlR family transcriptional regulator